MKRQLNFCLFVTVLLLAGLLLFIYSIEKDAMTIKKLYISWALLSMTCFSLLVFLFGVIRYAKKKYLEEIHADTSISEEFFRVGAIVGLPLPEKTLIDLITNKPTQGKIPDMNETIRYARIVFEEGLLENSS